MNKNLTSKNINLCFEKVVLGDAIQELKKIEDKSVDLILSDIPYGIGFDEWDVLHNNTNTSYGGQSKAFQDQKVFARRGKPINGWSEADKKIPLEYQQWCELWLPECFRVLKEGGSIILFAGRRYSHRCIVAMENSGFNLRDLISWNKTKAPQRAQKLSGIFEKRKENELANIWGGWKLGNLQPLFEPIIWGFKPYKKTITDNIIENQLGAFYPYAFEKHFNTPSNIISCGIGEEDKQEIQKIKNMWGESFLKETKLHPTQKPLKLMEALIELTTIEGQVVLDPFAGSGTTLVASKKLKRSTIGIEMQSNFFDIINKRLSLL